MQPSRRRRRRKRGRVAEEDERGVAQVELEGVWGFETKMADVDALQAEDDEVKLIRAIRNGADYTKLEAVPAAFAAVNAYKSTDLECQNFVGLWRSTDRQLEDTGRPWRRWQS